MFQTSEPYRFVDFLGRDMFFDGLMAISFNTFRLKTKTFDGHRNGLYLD
jgi:hypothetical protein